MRNLILLSTIATALLCPQLSGAQELLSPNKRLRLEASLNSHQQPCYSLWFDGKPVVLQSTLGLKAIEADLTRGFKVVDTKTSSSDTTWQPVWGEYSEVRDNHNELAVTYSQPDGKTFTVRYRLFDDGLGFRYELPLQDKLNYLTLTGEATQFNLPADNTLYYIPGDYDTDEYLYSITPLTQTPEKVASYRGHHTESQAIDAVCVQTPLLMKSPDGSQYVNIHEAALVGYPGLSLDVDTAQLSLSARLTPDRNGVAGYIQLPFNTPWRTIIVSDDARDILASQLIFNLNEPCALDDTSWITPQKFMGVWWEMFLGNGRSWAYSDDYRAKPGITDYSKLQPSGRHAANNDNVKRYIDFASKAGIPGLLVEGWNQGWEDWASYRKNRQFLFDQPYPDFNVDSLQAYANQRGVRLIMHHETAANAADYERQLDRAFQYMVDHGYNSVKTGYVGAIIPRSEHHSSQWMVDHYLHVAKRAADYKIMVDSHEAVRPTGLCRTYPNWVAQESARGGEFESMGGNPPSHTAILPFTRLKGGPMDYTPGLFVTKLSEYGKNQSQAGTTLARQLALYLTMPSPLQMACDLPENYERYWDAFQFIRDVPVDWSDSRYLEAEPARYITVARKDKHSDDWYVGAITDDTPRTATVDLSFLNPGQRYQATIYRDGDKAHYITNPQDYHISSRTVTAKTKLQLPIAPGGGFAIRITPAN